MIAPIMPRDFTTGLTITNESMVDGFLTAQNRPAWNVLVLSQYMLKTAWPWPLKTPWNALPASGDWLVGEPPPMGVQLLVESPVLLSQMSFIRFNVTPLKVVVPLLTNCATPANCSGVVMLKEVWLALYHETSAVPFQTV